jgi:hypothetical protein
MILAVFVSFLVLILFGGCATGKGIPKDLGLGTWVNEKMSPQKEIDTVGGWKQYLHTSDSSPFYEGTGKLISQWTDSEGNIWQKVLSTFTAPDAYKGQIFTNLAKYSKSGTVRESVWQSPTSDAEMKNPVYPSKIDPQNPNYSIYYLQK